MLPAKAITGVAPFIDPIARLFGSDAMSPMALETLNASPAVDGSKARNELGFDPRPTAETVQDLVTFFAEMDLLGG